VLVDHRNDAMKSYEYSIVQYRDIWTKEVINIGVVLSTEKDRYIHLPKHFDKLKNCLSFVEASGIEYTIDIIRDRIENQKVLQAGEVSNSIYITEPKTFLSEYEAEEALYDAVDSFMMVAKLREPDESVTRTDRYDKMSILKLIESRAKEKNIVNFRHHRRFGGVAKKIIDMAMVDVNDRPYSVATLASVHKSHFEDSLITAVFTLEEAMRNDFIKDGFLYVPVMKDESSMTLKEKRDLGWAKEQAEHYKLDILTDRRQDAALERLQSHKPIPALQS